MGIRPSVAAGLNLRWPPTTTNLDLKGRDLNNAPLRIAIVVETYARDMGYINNTLPKYLARAGHEVHVVTTELPPYFQIGAASEVFGQAFADKNRNDPGSISWVDGYAVHTLQHRKRFGYPQPQGLGDCLKEIKPQVVCIFQAAGWIPLLCAQLTRTLGFKLVIGSHMGKTVFPLATDPSLQIRQRIKSFLLRKVPGRYIDFRSHHCIVPTRDCGEVAGEFFGIAPRKIRVMNLPVDTDFFHPVRDETDRQERARLRKELGFDANEVVCVYSGKFTREKNPLVLAEAVQRLRAQGLPVRALFIGEGEQAERLRAQGTVVPFMPIRELGSYFRAADIGVWMNESISFLDAACAGLPLLLGDVVKDVSHLVEFSTQYRTNDPASLANSIHPLLDADRRQEVSASAARLGFDRFGAEGYSALRVLRFRQALDGVPIGTGEK